MCGDVTAGRAVDVREASPNYIERGEVEEREIEPVATGVTLGAARDERHLTGLRITEEFWRRGRIRSGDPPVVGRCTTRQHEGGDDAARVSDPRCEAGPHRLLSS